MLNNRKDVLNRSLENSVAPSLNANTLIRISTASIARRANLRVHLKSAGTHLLQRVELCLSIKKSLLESPWAAKGPAAVATLRVSRLPSIHIDCEGLPETLAKEPLP